MGGAGEGDKAHVCNNNFTVEQKQKCLESFEENRSEVAETLKKEHFQKLLSTIYKFLRL